MRAVKVQGLDGVGRVEIGLLVKATDRAMWTRVTKRIPTRSSTMAMASLRQFQRRFGRSGIGAVRGALVARPRGGVGAGLSVGAGDAFI